jgi:hypothetical protein
MDAPIIFISRFHIREGRRSAFERAFVEAVELISATKPRTALFAAYVESGGAEVRIVHAFLDAAAMAAHFEGSETRSRSVDELLAPAGYAVYGPAADKGVDQLAREASASQVRLEVIREPIAGFLRPPA